MFVLSKYRSLWMRDLQLWIPGDPVRERVSKYTPCENKTETEENGFSLFKTSHVNWKKLFFLEEERAPIFFEKEKFQNNFSVRFKKNRCISIFKF